jgi:hypothetical protein
VKQATVHVHVVAMMEIVVVHVQRVHVNVLFRANVFVVHVKTVLLLMVAAQDIKLFQSFRKAKKLHLQGVVHVVRTAFAHEIAAATKVLAAHMVSKHF